jgi:AraC-like DNA-binding protein
MGEAARKADWVDSVYSDLVQTVGRGLPKEFRGFSRRVFESPVRYSSISSVASPFGLSAGALKARFRRRGLPSPYRHLSWFRLIAASRVLSDPSETILSASYRMGFASDGNFCRWVNSTSGLTPTDLREWNGRLLLIVRMAERFLAPEHLDAWESFGGAFLRQVA